jgi:hypothetical protein
LSGFWVQMDLRRKIDGVDVIASENEVWFVQEGRICWTTREELWSGSSRLSRILREKGYRIHSQSFPKKLRELVLTLSKSG